MRKILMAAMAILFSQNLQAATFGIGATGGININPSDGDYFSNFYAQEVRSNLLSIDFYGDISLSRSNSTFKNVLNEILAPMNYRISFATDIITMKGYYNYGDVFDTSAVLIRPEISAALLYNLYDTHGYFLDIALAYNYRFSSVESSTVGGYNGNTMDIEPFTDYLSYEIGLGKSFKSWAIRLFYRTSLLEDDYIVKNETENIISSFTISNPSSINLSLILWW